MGIRNTILLLAFLPVLAILVLPLLWSSVGSLFGVYLRRKTEGRRQHLVQLMNEDEKSWRLRTSSSSKDTSSDDDWENVESHSAGSSGNGEKGSKDFSGIVGFFHPFW